MEYVYILSADEPCDGYYKIGRAKDPEKRLSQITLMPFEINLLHMVRCKDASRIESALHSHFDDVRVNGEWFKLDDDSVQLIISVTSEQELLGRLSIDMPCPEDEVECIRVKIVLAKYLENLCAKEEAKPESERRDVPTIRELAESVGIHEVTLHNISKSKIKHLNLQTAQRIMDEMRRRGFNMQISDFIDYIPPDTD